jgi:hypothetical protein
MQGWNISYLRSMLHLEDGVRILLRSVYIDVPWGFERGAIQLRPQLQAVRTFAVTTRRPAAGRIVRHLTCWLRALEAT